MPSPATTAAPTPQLPAELRLLLLCSHWSFTEEDDGRVRALLAGSLDWSFFLTLCGHHRVAPLVYRTLERLHSSTSAPVPADVLAVLKNAATRNTHNTLRYLAEVQRLRNLLQQAGVSVCVLKGVALSQQVFHDPGLRDVGDIDLLISPQDEEAADRVLLADGFVRNDPAAPLTPRRRRSWRQHGKSYTYADAHSGFELDVHWRLFRNPHMAGNTLSQVSREQVLLGDTVFDVLPLQRMFLYLCVHGALDGWFRFKSLVDVTVLWQRWTAEQRDSITTLAREQGVLPELAAALRLAVDLELLRSDEVPPALHLQAEGAVPRAILDYAHAQHTAQRYQPTQDGAGSWALKRYELGMRSGLAYRWEILRRVLLRPRVWERFDLPDALFPLYGLLSPLEWVVFHRTVAPAAVARRSHSRWRRLLALPRIKQLQLAEALSYLIAARIALSVLPVRWVFRWLERPLQTTTPAGGTAERIRWAVLCAARYTPFSFVCFPQALAAHAMLRRRRISSVMHYGVRRSADGQMHAHTWLEVEQRTLLGGESAGMFTLTRSAVPGRTEL